MRLALVLAIVLVAGCKKSADKASVPAPDDKTKDVTAVRPADPTDNLKGGSGPGGGIDAGVTGSLPTRGVLEILDGQLEILAGAIDKDVVKKVVKENTQKLQYCYEKTLLANPGIEGKVITTFTIAAEGSVSDVKATGVHPEVETCVADTVKAFKFPPSGKKVDVSYPFAFKPA